MFSKIIIGTDLSEASMEIVRCACGLLPLGTKEVFLVNCIKPWEAASIAYTMSLDKIKEMLKEQEKILIKQGFKTHSKIISGSAHREINQIAKDDNYSAILIGSHGHTLSHEVPLGSVASEMIHHALKPIILIKLEVINNGKERENVCKAISPCNEFLSSILYPTDFSQNSDEAFAYVEGLVENNAKKVTLLHVQDMIKLEKNTKKELKEFDRIDTERLGVMKERLIRINKDTNIEIKILHGKPSIEIVKFANSNLPSLVVMGNQGRGFVKELFIGNVSHTVAREINTSMLLIPSKNR
jgi:nucleotide-binding universal stress UspA family protein